MEKTIIFKLTASFVAITFIVTTMMPYPGYAQEILPRAVLPVTATTPFTPPTLRGIIVHPENPFQFDFIVDEGDNTFAKDALKLESKKLIKYFLTALTIPEDDLWVNLSPSGWVKC